MQKNCNLMVNFGVSLFAHQNGEVTVGARDGAAHVLRCLKVWYDLPSDVLFVATNLVDRFLTKMRVRPKHMACISVGSFLLAVRQLKLNINDTDDLVSISQVINYIRMHSRICLRRVSQFLFFVCSSRRYILSKVNDFRFHLWTIVLKDAAQFNTYVFIYFSWHLRMLIMSRRRFLFDCRLRADNRKIKSKKNTKTKIKFRGREWTKKKWLTCAVEIGSRAFDYFRNRICLLSAHISLTSCNGVWVSDCFSAAYLTENRIFSIKFEIAFCKKQFYASLLKRLQNKYLFDEAQTHRSDSYHAINLIFFMFSLSLSLSLPI